MLSENTRLSSSATDPRRKLLSSPNELMLGRCVDGFSGRRELVSHRISRTNAPPGLQAVPPTVRPSMRKVGWPTPTGTLWPSLPQVPTPLSSLMSLPIIVTRVSASGPLPTMVAPLTG